MRTSSRAFVQGYSHGSLITSLFSLPEDPRFQNLRVSHILLSYPLGPRSWLTAFRGNHYASGLTKLLKGTQSRVLVIFGDRDEFTGHESYDTWSKSLRHDAGDMEGRLEIVCAQGANHFWSEPESRELMLCTIRDWIP